MTPNPLPLGTAAPRPCRAMGERETRRFGSSRRCPSHVTEVLSGNGGFLRAELGGETGASVGYFSSTETPSKGSMRGRRQKGHSCRVPASPDPGQFGARDVSTPAPVPETLGERAPDGEPRPSSHLPDPPRSMRARVSHPPTQRAGASRVQPCTKHHHVGSNPSLFAAGFGGPGSPLPALKAKEHRIPEPRGCTADT